MAADTNGAAARQKRALMMAQNTMIGREQGPELFWQQTVTLATPQTIQIPRFVNLNRPLESIRVILSGRLALATYDYSAVAPEHFTNLLQQFQLNGAHRKYGNVTPIRQHGANIFAQPSLFTPKGERNTSALIVNGVLAKNSDLPFAYVNEAGTNVFLGTTGTSPWDFQIIWTIPLGPIFPPSAGDSQRDVSFLYQPQDWADSLQITITLGDKTSLGTPQASSVVTWTAFGSGAGSPSLEVHNNYSILGAFANQVMGGFVVRSESDFNSNTAVASGTRLALLQHQITANVAIKSGINLTGTTAGVSVYASLSDTQLGTTNLRVDNKPIRDNRNNMIAKFYGAQQFAAAQPQGWLNFSFVDSQNPLTAYRADGLAGGSVFEIVSDILTANANNRQTLIQEMYYGGPFPPLRPSA